MTLSIVKMLTTAYTEINVNLIHQKNSIQHPDGWVKPNFNQQPKGGQITTTTTDQAISTIPKSTKNMHQQKIGGPMSTTATVTSAPTSPTNLHQLKTTIKELILKEITPIITNELVKALKTLPQQ